MRSRRTLSASAAALIAIAGTGWTVASAAGPDDQIGKSGTELLPDQIGRSANVEHLINIPSSGALAGATGTDIAFQGDHAFVGNYNGFVIYDISDPAQPKTVVQVSCPGSQNDVSVNGNLLYLSTDSSRSDDSCASTSQSATIKDSWEGIKIFDISDVAAPKYITSVETTCGSHTNTLVPDGKGTDYLYVSSYGPRSEYPDCTTPHDLISIVKVPTARPTAAAVVDTPVLFPDGGFTPGEGDGTRRETSGCHDITALPERKIAAGACMGDGIILDISNAAKPKVIERVTDPNFSFWHSATFNEKANKVVFTDELGGGGAATCNTTEGPERGANAIYDLSKNNKLSFRSYFKIDRHQFDSENCVSHNGSLIPVAGRDIMVQSWYMGGTSIWDFTDSENPRELGYFERGPAAGNDGGGTWSSYYYNGHIYSSDLGKGFDVLKFVDPVTKDADKLVLDQLNPQSQLSYLSRGRA
ncbi:LVIVD repeat-containing protein [Janibacter sp. G56]|uniref:LVIVD repeat-containing protein n=1 Tax=Janibacter sp. G56 TaxID=3418717 RepID=UPI003D039BD3